MKRNKYGVAPKAARTWNGIVFASKREMDRWKLLQIWENCQIISELERQPAFPCVVEGKKICTYKADARYRRNETGEVIVEDSKGVRTRVYRLKKKLVEALYGIEIKET